MNQEPSSWQVVPYTSFGPLVLGMARHVVRSLLGQPDRSFIKSRFDGSPSDSYHRLGFRLDFDGDDRLEFVEASSPCDVVYQGLHLLRADLQGTVGQLRKLGHEVGEYSSVGPRFHDIGLAFYSPDPPRVEAVALFRRGYYDEPLANPTIAGER